MSNSVKIESTFLHIPSLPPRDVRQSWFLAVRMRVEHKVWMEHNTQLLRPLIHIVAEYDGHEQLVSREWWEQGLVSIPVTTPDGNGGTKQDMVAIHGEKKIASLKMEDKKYDVVDTDDIPNTPQKAPNVDRLQGYARDFTCCLAAWLGKPASFYGDNSSDYRPEMVTIDHRQCIDDDFFSSSPQTTQIFTINHDHRNRRQYPFAYDVSSRILQYSYGTRCWTDLGPGLWVPEKECDPRSCTQTAYCVSGLLDPSVLDGRLVGQTVLPYECQVVDTYVNVHPRTYNNLFRWIALYGLQNSKVQYRVETRGNQLVVSFAISIVPPLVVYGFPLQ